MMFHSLIMFGRLGIGLTRLVHVHLATNCILVSLGDRNSSAGRQSLSSNGRPHASDGKRNITFGFALDYDKTHQWHASPQGQNIETKAFAYGLCR